MARKPTKRKPTKRTRKRDKLARPPVERPARRHLSPGPIALALAEYRGNLASVARSFGVTRNAVWEYVNARPDLVSALSDARETRVDDAESSLDKAVAAGEGWAVALTLKTLGKGRGYVERQEHEHTGTTRLVIEEEVVGADPGDDPTPGEPVPAAG